MASDQRIIDNLITLNQITKGILEVLNFNNKT